MIVSDLTKIATLGTSPINERVRRYPVTIPTSELCARYRRLYVPAVSDALYQLGMAEQVLPSALRPLLPDQRIAGVAHTVLGEAIDPPIDWEPGIEVGVSGPITSLRDG